jgi:ABC-type uncharacterized transport system YnjBCD permease subunit
MAPTFTSTAIAGFVVPWIAFQLNDSGQRVAKSFKIVLRAGAKARPRTVFFHLHCTLIFTESRAKLNTKS